MHVKTGDEVLIDRRQGQRQARQNQARCRRRPGGGRGPEYDQEAHEGTWSAPAGRDHRYGSAASGIECDADLPKCGKAARTGHRFLEETDNKGRRAKYATARFAMRQLTVISYE